jgi:hypothetical protein
MKLTKNFSLLELIDPILALELENAGLIRLRLENDRIVADAIQDVSKLFKPEMLKDLQFIRDNKGITLINDWYKQKRYVDTFKFDRKTDWKKLFYANLEYIVDEAGTRPFDAPSGAENSNHKYRLALDVKTLECSPKELKSFIEENSETLSITKIIEYDTWLHLEWR